MVCCSGASAVAIDNKIEQAMVSVFNIKLQRNEPLYNNTVIGILAVDGWAVTLGTARRSLGGLRPRPVPSSMYQM